MPDKKSVEDLEVQILLVVKDIVKELFLCILYVVILTMPLQKHIQPMVV